MTTPLRRLLLVAALAALVAACGGNGNGDEDATPPAGNGAAQPDDAEPAAPVFERGTAVIETDEGEVRVLVEIAETDEQRQFGLMFRRALPEDEGMVFLFPEDAVGGFWMKNTYIPLSIAFADADGRIVDILDMEPCPAEPCPTYAPESAYRTALEVNVGAFERWGVEPGDVLRLERRG